jgi:hypothetical protein
MTTDKRHRWARYILLFVFCVLILSCSSGSGGGGQTNARHVYTAGSSLVNEVNIPVYWKDSTIVELSRIDATCSGYANSIVAEGQNIHIAGTTFVCAAGGTAETPVAAYWKNGVRTDLERPAAHALEASEAQQVIVVNGDVYIAGYVTGDNGPLPVYWHNGNLVYLNSIPYGGTKARASNIYVDGSDVYVSGAALFDTAYPVYWKNGTAYPLPLPSGYRGTSVPLPIYVAGGNVYVFGHLHRKRTPTNWDTSERPVYWENAVLAPLFPLTDGAGYSYGGTVFNGVPYSAGAYVDGALYTPSVWANHLRQPLTMIDAGLYGMAHDVFVNWSGIFVAGWTYQSADQTDPEALLTAVPCYWVNGRRVDLPALRDESAYAREIFVSP